MEIVFKPVPYKPTSQSDSKPQILLLIILFDISL